MAEMLRNRKERAEQIPNKHPLKLAQTNVTNLNCLCSAVIGLVGLLIVKFNNSDNLKLLWKYRSTHNRVFTNSLSNQSYRAQSKSMWTEYSSWQVLTTVMSGFMIFFQWIWLVVITLNVNVHKQICEQEEIKKGEFSLSTLFVRELYSWCRHSSAWSVFQLFFQTQSSPSKTVEKLVLTQKLIFFFFFSFLNQAFCTNALSEWTATPTSSETLCQSRKKNLS